VVRFWPEVEVLVVFGVTTTTGITVFVVVLVEEDPDEDPLDAGTTATIT